MITVCHIVSGDLWAGAEVMASQLIRALHDMEGISVSAIVMNPGRFVRELEGAGVPVHVVDEAEVSFSGILWRVRKILKGIKPDVIHAHRYKENIIAFLAGGFSFSSGLVTTQHGMAETEAERPGRVKRAVTRLNLFLLKYGFHRVVCVSRELREGGVARYGLREERVPLIYNGVGCSGNAHTVRERPFITVGSAGRLSPVKDFSLMIDIAAEMKQRGIGVRFRLAGEGPLRESLVKRAASLELGNGFEFSGHVDGMASFYKSLDIYLNTSLHEGIPMSILEAMSHGLPVVAPDVGGIGEIITHGAEGYLIGDRSPVLFADAIERLSENKRLRRQVACQAMATVRERFSRSGMARHYFRVYSDLRGRDWNNSYGCD